VTTAGFGSGPFGSGPFGRYDWARKMLWLDIPEQPDRALDAKDPLHPLEGFQESVMPLFEEMLGFAIDYEHLRDPDDVRTKFQDVITGLTITSATVETTGRTTRVEFNDPDPNDPLVPLERTSIGWILTDSNGDEFTVNTVHKLSTAVIIKGNVLPATGAATLRPQALIGELGADYGIIVDQHDPEQFQRSSVRNAWQWLAVKGAELGYDIVAKIAGYRVTALPLYRISAGWEASLSPSHVYEVPIGSGIWFTDLDPLRPRFDAVAADVVPLDAFCWEDRGDGVTYGEQIGEATQGVTIASTTDLGDGLWRIEVSGADLSAIAAAGAISETQFATWYATFPSGDSGQFWLEDTPVDLGGGSYTFDVQAGTTPTFGSTVNIDYACTISLSCDFCRASAIRFEIRPEEILTDPEALFAGALERMVRKLLEAVPIHVRVVEIAHIVEVDLDVGVVGSHLILTGVQQKALFSYLPVGYYFDMVPADELPLDPNHLVLPGTQYTIP